MLLLVLLAFCWGCRLSEPVDCCLEFSVNLSFWLEEGVENRSCSCWMKRASCYLKQQIPFNLLPWTLAGASDFNVGPVSSWQVIMTGGLVFFSWNMLLQCDITSLWPSLLIRTVHTDWVHLNCLIKDFIFWKSFRMAHHFFVRYGIIQ